VRVSVSFGAICGILARKYGPSVTRWEGFGMLIESKVQRRFWVNSLLGLIPDAVIAVILAGATETGLLGFLATNVGLQVLYGLLWAKTSVWGWIMFSLWGRKQIARQLADYLRENGYPDPGESQSSVDGYLNSVLNDETLPIVVRLKAAGELGSMSAPMFQGFQAALRLHMAYEDALEEHKRTFPVP
jgi:hypothetical protein